MSSFLSFLFSKFYKFGNGEIQAEIQPSLAWLSNSNSNYLLRLHATMPIGLQSHKIITILEYIEIIYMKNCECEFIKWDTPWSGSELCNLGLQVTTYTYLIISIIFLYMVYIHLAVAGKVPTRTLLNF
jgi:hypothetical protein